MAKKDNNPSKLGNNMSNKAANNAGNTRRSNDYAESLDASVDDLQLSEDRVGRSGQWGDPTDAPVVEISFEEILELQEEIEGDDTLGDIIDTAHTDGSTENVQVAMDQGLVYTPPTDPPVVPSDDLQNVEIAAGFASSIDEDIEIANLPERVDGNDTDVEDDIRRALRQNSETTHLDDVRVYVRDGIAYIRGTVLDEEDIALVDDFVRDLDVVDDIQNDLVSTDDMS